MFYFYIKSLVNYRKAELLLYTYHPSYSAMATSYLLLEDGTVMEGESFGYDSSGYGEVVFTTGMCGYQEGLTDPSFRGQILIFTYPLIGNYGIRKEFEQSDSVHVRGVVVSEYCEYPSKAYGGEPLADYLKAHKIPAISGIDTRALVVKIRQQGAFKGAIINDASKIEETLKELRTMKSPMADNLVAEVCTKTVKHVDNGMGVTVGIIDCGTKKKILDQLSRRFDLEIFPYDTPAQVIIDSGVKGVMITNGPGDPAHPALKDTTVKTIKDLSSVMPMAGICFGSQLIGLAMGGNTYKMKFGHRGSNQPVKYNGRVYITSQNHGYAVDDESLDGTGLVVDQVNVNDGTVEGVRHRDLPIFTCQYHPEAAPGPDDTTTLFDKFKKMVLEAKQ